MENGQCPFLDDLPKGALLESGAPAFKRRVKQMALF
jgi:hypothetical protein